MTACAAQDASYRRQLAEFDSNKRNQEEEKQNLERRMRELQADEEFKSANCKMCPKCGRVVQKLDGCNLMICGQNYHGGDNQNGCGTRFDWARASPYKVNVGNHLTLNEAKNKKALVAPEKARLHQHTWSFDGQVRYDII